MGTIKNNKKIKRITVQKNPYNPTGNTKMNTNQFDSDKKTIKDQKSKQ